VRAIFVSYRRHDAEGEAGRLFDDLVEQFGEHSVFMDVAAIEVGRDFRKAIDESIATCGVLLAVIGAGWLDEKNDAGLRRLEDPNDFVRMEIASALKRDIPVVPVLVRGAKMPRADQLPEDVKELAYRNAVELTHARWKSDIKLLIRSLRAALGDSRDIVTARGVKESVYLQRPPSFSGPGTPVEHPSTVANQATTHVQPSAITNSNSPPSSPCAAKLDPQLVERITEELADYIGPIAEVVVKRAAKQCSTVVELRRAVADEIETSAERTRFLNACRDS
jgi:hypothetical protein